MNADELRMKIPDYVAGRLDEGERAAVELALERHPECDEYLRTVQSFYSVDAEVGLVLEPGLPPARPARSWGRAAAMVAAALLIAFGAYRFGTRERPTDAPVTGVASIDLVPLALALPDVPDLPTDGEWLDDETTARLVSEYSGKPLLRAYVMSHCPRCRAFEPALASERGRRLVTDYVPVKIGFASRLPEALRIRQSEVTDTMFIHTPALIAGEEGHDFPAAYDVGDLRAMRLYLDAFAEQRTHDGRVPLDSEAYREARARLWDVADLLRENRWGDALTTLEELADLDIEHRTRFAAEAERLHAHLVAQIDARIERARSTPATLESIRQALGPHEKSAQAE